MSKFLSKLDVRLVDGDANDGRGAWALDSDLVYASDVAGATFTVPRGYVTDFASVPRWPAAYWLFGDTSHAAAVIHDYLYTQKRVPRALADRVLREASAVSGVPAWRRWPMWLAVRLGGGFAWAGD